MFLVVVARGCTEQQKRAYRLALPLGQAAMKAAGAGDDDPVFARPAGARPKAATDNTREWPRKTFAEQPVGGKRRRGRPRKNGAAQPDLPPAA
jgi:hypothetical protein